MELYGVSIINKYDVWLREDEGNPYSWAVMNRDQLEYHLQRKMKRKEIDKGRDIVGYDDILWNRIT